MLSGFWTGWGALHTSRQRLTYGDFIYSPLSVFIGVGLLFTSRYLVRERYLLESGGGRYTIGEVSGYHTWRGIDRFTCAYMVGGQPFRTQQDCGIVHGQALPCPPLQARRFVVFAPEDPGTAQVLDAPVPDTLRYVPPQGWPRLPLAARVASRR